MGLVSRFRRAGPADRASWHGIDFHILMTLLFRGWGILAGAVTIVLLPTWLSPAQQGYYYTFASLLALQVFFELGLSQVITQLVSHEAAHLSFHGDGSVHGDAEHLARLAGIVELVRRWYMVAAMLFAIFGSTAGWLFFGRHEQSLPVNAWAPVWGVVMALSAINLYLSPQLAIIEGSGYVGQVARLRLIQSMTGYSALWVFLLLGANLWVTTAVPLVSAVVTLLWLRTRGSWLKRVHHGSVSAISWRRDVFPLQWRIAVSWACGYFIFNLFTPIVFSSHGAAEAGRLGMAMSVFSAVSTLGLSWINAKVPVFTMHISRGESTMLNRLFDAVILRSVAAVAALAFTVVAVVALAAHAEVAAIHRIASSWTLFWIACATVVNTVIWAAATYMRAHREEPMLPISVVVALLTVATVLLTREDITLMMFTYAAICSCVALPWATVLLKRYRAPHIAASLANAPDLA